MKLVAGFDSTSDAILMEDFCKNKKIDGELIPIPEEFEATCGLAFKFEDDNFKKVKKILDDEDMSYKILKLVEI